MSVTGGAGKSLESLQHPRSASAVRLPPLTRATSLATGMAGMFDPREEKLNEMERMLNQYQEKLETVTNNYEEKVTILENRLVDREMDEHPRPEEGGHGGNLFLYPAYFYYFLYRQLILQVQTLVQILNGIRLLRSLKSRLSKTGLS